MGTWGTGLYANDSTCDVRDSYMQLLQEGLSNTEAYEKTLEKYREYIGDQDEPLFWFALAETQWRMGCLIPEVKEKALEWIENDGGLELWKESDGGGTGWKKTLQNLRLKLLTTMPPEKKIRIPQIVNNNLWNVNDVYAYQFNGEGSEKHGFKGKYMLIQKIGEGMREFPRELAMRIHVVDRVFDELPTLEDMDELRILPVDFPTRVSMNKDPIWMSALIYMSKKTFYPAKYLTFIGNRKGPANNMINNRELAWSHIDTWLYEFHQLWNGIKYETIGEGVYRYNQA
ncbi:MAG: hypothetical protein GX660_07665 [Clostridiaceae bacterium]|nr:hypothetical protein [Clostridiaceae bacterium]